MEITNTNPTPEPAPTEPKTRVKLPQDLSSFVDAIANSLFDNTDFIELLEDKISTHIDDEIRIEDKLLDNRDVITDIVKEDIYITADLSS